MTEEARNIVEALHMCPDPKCICRDCPVYVPGKLCQNELKAADLIESLSEQLEQVTRERDVAIGQLNQLGCGFGMELTAMFENVLGKANAEPVRHGYWIGLEYDGYADGCPVYDLWECSECGLEHKGEDAPNFCPNCGAKMDAEVEG